MNYLEPQGFLGTGASLLADLTLLAYILLIVPGMIAGFLFARMGKHRPQHKWTMITITVVNWALIIFLMIAAYRFDVVGNIGSQPANPRYLMPTIHGILGLPAQLLATYVIYRMLREDTLVARGKKRGESKEQLRKYWFLNAKPIMRLTLALWLITSLLGVFNYLVRYDVLSIGGTGQGTPIATPEATPDAAPAATPDVTPAAEAESPAPAVTPDAEAESPVPAATEAAESESPVPAATEAAEDEPAATPEATP